MRGRAVALLASLLTLAAACLPGAAPTPAEEPGPAAAAKPAPVALPADVLWVREHQSRIWLVDVRTGERLRDLPAGTATRDWSTLYAAQHTATADGERTAVRAVDPSTGSVRAEVTLDGEWSLPSVGLLRQGGLSGNERWLAVVKLQRATPGADPRSEVAVIPADLASPPKRVSLRGTFLFDALADDGRTLYLIELVSPADGRYRVRAYDLEADRLLAEPIGDPKLGVGPENMRGWRADSVTAAGSPWNLGLYSRGTRGPFIHALNTRQRFAVCLFLPDRPGGGETDLMWTLAPAPDGATVYAVNAGTGVVSAIDTRGAPRILGNALFPVSREQSPLERLYRWMVPLADAKMEALHGAVVSPDGKTLVAARERGLVVIDTATLSLRERWLEDRISSLAFSPDGEHVYALAQGSVLVIDAATAHVVGRVSRAASTAIGIERVTSAGR